MHLPWQGHQASAGRLESGMGGGHWWQNAQNYRLRVSVDLQQLCGLPQESLLHPFPPHSPSLGLALHLKFKGFKCKYFSFIDASCLQRARFLAAQLYCPISFLYQGTGEPGGLRGGAGEGSG